MLVPSHVAVWYTWHGLTGSFSRHLRMSPSLLHSSQFSSLHIETGDPFRHSTHPLLSFGGGPSSASSQVTTPVALSHSGIRQGPHIPGTSSIFFRSPSLHVWQFVKVLLHSYLGGFSASPSSVTSIIFVHFSQSPSLQVSGHLWQIHLLGLVSSIYPFWQRGSFNPSTK